MEGHRSGMAMSLFLDQDAAITFKRDGIIGAWTREPGSAACSQAADRLTERLPGR